MRILLFLLSLGYLGLINGHPFESLQEHIIWTDSKNDEGQYIVFNKTFQLDNVDEKDTIDIFADSRYMMWLNGDYVNRGPVRFNPQNPEYDIIPASQYLKPGKNIISIMVYHYGDVINGRIMNHHPGLGLTLRRGNKAILHTDSTWKFNSKTRYLSSPASWNTIPSIIDGRIDAEEWLKCSDTNDSRSAIEIDGSMWGKICPTESPKYKETSIKDIKDAHSGNILMFPLTLSSDAPIVIDLGEMSMAYIDMDLDANADLNLRIKPAIRFKNGQTSESFGAGDQYITRQGQQHFITADQWCARYVTLSVDSGAVTINQLNIVNRIFPFKRVGSFECNDDFFNRLWDMGVHTIAVTSDDAYGSDARERNEWIQDAYRASFLTSNVSLSSLVDSTVDCTLLKRMLRHAALSQHTDGMLSATFPTDRGPEDCHYIIEDYALQWIEALWHYYWLTNDLTFVKDNRDTLIKLIEWFEARITENGLVFAREYASFDNPLAYVFCEGATLNAYLYGTLQSAISLMKVSDEHILVNKYKDMAQHLKENYIKHLWSKEDGAIRAGIIENEKLAPSVHAQIMALYYGLLDEKQTEMSRRWLLENFQNQSLTHCCNNPDYREMLNQKSGVNMPITFHWLLKVLYDIDTPEMDAFILDEIAQRWNYMVNLQSDAGTLAESFVKSDGTGSHESCHNYGSTPVYYLSAYVLGVRETSDGIIISPRLGNLKYARGKVPTSKGIIEVDWQKDENNKLKYTLKVPPGIKYTLKLPQ